MKVFANNRVYVQKKDLIHLLRFCSFNNNDIPAGIINKVFGNVFIVNSDNEYDFIEFYCEDEIEFFRSLDWIVDYHSFDGMSDDDILKAACGVAEEGSNIVKGTEELSKEELDRISSSINTELELIEYKMLGIRDVLWHKQGHLKFTLPEGSNSTHKKRPRGRVLRSLIDKFL